MSLSRFVRRGLTLVLGGTVAFGLGMGAAAAIDMLAPTAHDVNCVDSPESGPVQDPGNCRTENRTWTWYMDSSGEFELETPDRQVTTAAMQQWGSATVMTPTFDSTPVFSGDAETDVVYQEGYTPGFADSVEGVTWCVDIVSGSSVVCDSFYIRIRGAGVYTQKLVAHEAGHTLGLVHGGQANPVTSGTASIMGIMTTGTLPTSLGSEPVAQVNNFY